MVEHGAHEILVFKSNFFFLFFIFFYLSSNLKYENKHAKSVHECELHNRRFSSIAKADFLFAVIVYSIAFEANSFWNVVLVYSCEFEWIAFFFAFSFLPVSMYVYVDVDIAVQSHCNQNDFYESTEDKILESGNASGCIAPNKIAVRQHFASKCYQCDVLFCNAIEYCQ